VSTEVSGQTEAAEVHFDLDRAWQLHPQASVRPERFGALVYHFGTRKLAFLKNPTLLDVVRRLDTERDARAALVAAGVVSVDVPVYARALATLAGSKVICERTA
jgi:putative mycofactocin binding protein MftB